MSVADALDRLEPVLTGLDGGSVRPGTPALRFGSSPEYFTYGVVPDLDVDAPALVGAVRPRRRAGCPCSTTASSTWS